MEDHDDTLITTFKFATIWLVNYCISDYHIIAGNISITTTFLYVAWKWRRDYLKDKNEKK